MIKENDFEPNPVHRGEADAIYINCPPLGLGNCIGAELVSKRKDTVPLPEAGWAKPRAKVS